MQLDIQLAMEQMMETEDNANLVDLLEERLLEHGTVMKN
jgi:hypothetical protein